MRITRREVLGLLGSRGSPLFMSIWVPILFIVIDNIPFQLSLWTRTDRLLDRSFVEDGKEFDFIVVGAGLAGAVVANRLALAGGYSVLLIEAGGDPYPLQMIPGFLMPMLNNPETDWMFRTVPQTKGSLNSVKGESSWSVGKGLGGTGNLNIMVFLRGHYKDFDNWAKITNDSGWSFEGLLPHFKEIEEYTVKKGVANDEKYHGKDGDVFVDEPDYLGMADQFVATAGEYGYPKVDLNAPYKEGFDRVKYPIKNGRRVASYLSFIQSVRGMENLLILKYAHVNKILIDKNNKAFGVEYEKFGKVFKALAKKEVIISGGTVGSPKILLLSGIGPRKHLESLGIKVQQDLPVGLNLQDHLGVYLHPFFITPPKNIPYPLSIKVERDITLKSLLSWLYSGKGVLTSSGVQATGCISSSFAKKDSWPDIHYFLFGYSATSKLAPIVSKAFNLQEEEMLEYYSQGDFGEKESFNVIVTGARPFSRGYIQLASSNPKDPPVIDPKYLEDERDLEVLLEGVKLVVKMMENSTSVGKDLGCVFTGEKLPGCEEFEMRSDEYWICYIRRYSVTLHHPVGTVRMGSQDDEKSVVNTRLEVKGIKGLRVVDSSIQPVIIVTNTGASAMAIGAKGASIILKEWANKL